MKRVFAILALSLSATASAADAVTPCDLKVFPTDPDPTGTNVRSAPGSDAKVLGAIASEDSELIVTGSLGKWLRISHAQGVDGTTFFDGEGWVFANLTGVMARTATKLHASPDASSPVVGTMGTEDIGNVQTCRGQWLQVQTKKAKGWMAPGSHCGNPVTTCV